jgi:transcriptional regulator with XRE-family HTH domain
VKRSVKSGYEQFTESTSRRRLVEEEGLILEAVELLSTLMAAEGITKAELARRLGKSKAYVTQAMRGNSNLTLRTLAGLGCVLGYRFRLQANNLVSGRWTQLPDAPRPFGTAHRRMTARWRGRPEWSGEEAEPAPAGAHVPEDLPLCACA